MDNFFSAFALSGRIPPISINTQGAASLSPGLDATGLSARYPNGD